MLTPQGKFEKIDKVMLLGIWAKFLAQEQEMKEKPLKRSMIYAGMGKPTHPLHQEMSRFLSKYWNEHNGKAIDYGSPQGDLQARELMAEAMTGWYGLNINPQEILFNVGGAGALQVIFSALKTYTKKLNFRVITPFPYYSLYAENGLKLHSINVMKNPGYCLNAQSLLESIHSAHELARKDSLHPRALLLCDPNNPLGTVLGEKELKKIADVLRLYPDLIIILDEVYSELVLDGTKHVSLLTVAPELKERIIIIRSATKGLSAAGERMAVTLAFNPAIMSLILAHSILNCGHAPRSLQMAYANTMKQFTEANRKEINNYYRSKVDYVNKRLLEMGAAMPDKEYRVRGTFYVLADFSELLGEPLHKRAAEILEKKDKAMTDEDIAYNFLCRDSLMIAPASYYGMEKNKGYLRITCSDGENVLKKLMDRLEEHLKQNRLKKQQELKDCIEEKLTLLKKINPKEAINLPLLKEQLTSDPTKAAIELKRANKVLEQRLALLKQLISRNTLDGTINAAMLIQSTYRGYKARKTTRHVIKKQDEDWFDFVQSVSPKLDNEVGSYLKQLTVSERLQLEPWKEHLHSKNKEPLSFHFLFAFMSKKTLCAYTALVIFLAAASGLAISFGFWGTATLGIAATIIIGGKGFTAGLGFFSQSTKAPDLEEKEKNYENTLFTCC